MSRSDNVSYDAAILTAANLVVNDPNARKSIVVNTLAAIFQETAGVVHYDLTLEIKYLRRIG